jgi:isoprenylcysteine carboxyl methyltransferase (ICMT) family protein YpbQ
MAISRPSSKPKTAQTFEGYTVDAEADLVLECAPVTIDPRPIIGVCWLAFFVAWFIAVLVYGGGGRRQTTAGSIGLRLMMLAAAYLSVRYGERFQPFGDFANGLAMAGAILCVAGLAFAVWARVSLGRSWGMPMAQHDNPELVTSGPYRFVRHPIYTALGAMLLGTSLVFPVAALPCLATVAYMVFAARREERDMEQRFPAYAEYRRRSKFIVPFIL